MTNTEILIAQHIAVDKMKKEKPMLLHNILKAMDAVRAELGGSTDQDTSAKAAQFVLVFGEDSLEIIDQTRNSLLYHPAQEPLFHAVESMVKTETND